MERYLLTIAFCLGSEIMFSQKVAVPAEVPYEAIYRQQTGVWEEKIATLLFTKQKSLYYFNRTNKTREEAELREVGDSPNRFELVDKGDSEGICVYSDIREGKMISRVRNHANNQGYILNEPIPDFGWRITEEKMRIGDFNCTKATTSFRGRVWVVWFSEEVPVPAGPWKLQGLPGLIIQATTEDNRFYFKLERLIFPSANTTPIIPPKNGKKFDSWDNLCAYFKRDIDKWIKYMKSLGPGVTVSVEFDNDAGLEKMDF